jgi:hypothetical protein
MTLWTVVVAVVFPDTGVETLSVTDHGGIEARQQHMPVTPQLIHRTNQ